MKLKSLKVILLTLIMSFSFINVSHSYEDEGIFPDGCALIAATFAGFPGALAGAYVGNNFFDGNLGSGALVGGALPLLVTVLFGTNWIHLLEDFFGPNTSDTEEETDDGVKDPRPLLRNC